MLALVLCLGESIFCFSFFYVGQGIDLGIVFVYVGEN